MSNKPNRRYAGLALLVSLFAFAASTPAQAGTGFSCKVAKSENEDFIASVVFIGHDENSGSISVQDSLIQNFNRGEAVDGLAQIKANGDRLFNWQLTMNDADGVEAVMEYRAEYIAAGQKYWVMAKAQGYETIYEAWGLCEVETY